MESTIIDKFGGIFSIAFGIFHILNHKRIYDIYLRRTIFAKKKINNVFSKLNITFLQKYFQDTQPSVFDKAMAKYTPLVGGLLFLIFGLLMFFGII